FKRNVQYDCESAGCDTSGVRLPIQKYKYIVVHNPLARFFINSHPFHNAHLLRTTLPR
ncbi:hypothetical protein C8F04DRAFT_907563, partial [Mycena alexandri]